MKELKRQEIAIIKSLEDKEAQLIEDKVISSWMPSNYENSLLGKSQQRTGRNVQTH